MGWGQTTPREIAELVVRIRDGQGRVTCRLVRDVSSPDAHLLHRRGALRAPAVGAGRVEAGRRRSLALRSGARERAVRATTSSRSSRGTSRTPSTTRNEPGLRAAPQGLGPAVADASNRSIRGLHPTMENVSSRSKRVCNSHTRTCSLVVPSPNAVGPSPGALACVVSYLPPSRRRRADLASAQGGSFETEPRRWRDDSAGHHRRSLPDRLPRRRRHRLSRRSTPRSCTSCTRRCIG